VVEIASRIMRRCACHEDFRHSAGVSSSRRTYLGACNSSAE
jgi:hypothetical protein